MDLAETDAGNRASCKIPRNNPGKIVGNNRYGDSGKSCSEFMEIWLQNQRVPRILGVALPFNLEQHPVALSRSAHQLEQLVGKQCDDTKHEMKPDFLCSPNHDVGAAEVFLQPAVKPLRDRPFPVAGRLMRGQGNNIFPPRVPINDGDVSQAAAQLVDGLRIISLCPSDHTGNPPGRWSFSSGG